MIAVAVLVVSPVQNWLDGAFVTCRVLTDYAHVVEGSTMVASICISLIGEMNPYLLKITKGGLIGLIAEVLVRLI